MTHKIFGANIKMKNHISFFCNHIVWDLNADACGQHPDIPTILSGSSVAGDLLITNELLYQLS